MRPIDADELEKYIRDIIPDTIYSAYGEGVSEALMHLLAHIQATKEVKPVRHGHWTMFHNPRFPAYEIMQCSECKWEIHKSKVRGRDHYYFCPECGAKMKEESNK